MDNLETEREIQLLQLEEFIKTSTDQLNSFISSLGWSRDVLESKEICDMVICPLNSEHRVPQQNLERHVARCTLSQEGYKADEEFLSSSEFSSSPVVTLDSSTLEEVLEGEPSNSTSQKKSHRQRAPPRTSWRLLTDFTPAERSALHSYVVAKTKKNRVGTSLSLEDLQLPCPEGSKQSRPKSKIELLAEQRDAKRRRLNHKKVHTSRKTHTEILREVIRNQMEYLESQSTERRNDV